MAKTTKKKPEVDKKVIKEALSADIVTSVGNFPEKEVPKSVDKEVVKKVAPVVAFERWFRARSKERGFKPHWIAGMKAFTNTSSKKTMSEWDKVFERY